MPTQSPPEIKSVADAISAGVALADTNGAPPLPPADDSEEGEVNATQQDSADTKPDGAAPDGADIADGTGTGPADEKGADEAAGKDDLAAVEADPADADTGNAEADAAKDVKPGDKKPDPLTDPIPNALKPATKERIRTLVDRTKTAETSLTKVTEERNELIKAITDTGATPEQYAGVLDYLELVNSNDQNKLKKAANFMIRELAALSRVGGFRIPGVTSYSGHKDLEEAVAAGKIATELAEELAANRAATAHQGRVGAAQAQETEARRRYQEADTKARADMNTLEAQFARDPLYKEKKPLIVEMLNEMIKGDAQQGVPPLHPSKWAATYKRIYETLPKTLGGMRPVAQPSTKVPQNQPLRTQQPAGAQKQ